MFASRTNTPSSNPTISNYGGSNHAFIQPKLNIGRPGDKYEVEADKAADQIVARKEQSPSSFIAPSPIVQKKPEEEVQKQEQEETIQEKPVVESITPLIQRKSSEEEEVVQTNCTACEKEKEIQKKSSNDFFPSIQQKCDCHKDPPLYDKFAPISISPTPMALPKPATPPSKEINGISMGMGMPSIIITAI